MVSNSIMKFLVIVKGFSFILVVCDVITALGVTSVGSRKRDLLLLLN